MARIARAKCEGRRSEAITEARGQQRPALVAGAVDVTGFQAQGEGRLTDVHSGTEGGVVFTEDVDAVARRYERKSPIAIWQLKPAATAAGPSEAIELE